MDKVSMILVELFQQVDEDCPQDNRTDHLLNVMDDAREFIDHNKTEWVCAWVEGIIGEYDFGKHDLDGHHYSDVIPRLVEYICDGGAFWEAWEYAGEPLNKKSVELLLESDGYSTEDAVHEVVLKMTAG